jgi:hypothetical protein
VPIYSVTWNYVVASSALPGLESIFIRSRIGLVASQPDRHRAKLLNGRDVTVSGNVIGAGDLDAILPEQDGEING